MIILLFFVTLFLSVDAAHPLPDSQKQSASAESYDKKRAHNVAKRFALYAMISTMQETMFDRLQQLVNNDSKEQENDEIKDTVTQAYDTISGTQSLLAKAIYGFSSQDIFSQHTAVKREFIKMVDVLDECDYTTIKPRHIRLQLKQCSLFYDFISDYYMRKKRLIRKDDAAFFETVLLPLQYYIEQSLQCYEALCCSTADTILDTVIYKPVEFVSENKGTCLALVGLVIGCYIVYKMMNTETKQLTEEEKKVLFQSFIPEYAKILRALRNSKEGLRNQGNSCYFSAVTQALSASPIGRRLIEQSLSDTSENSQSAKTLSQLYQEAQELFFPGSFYGRQHDAAEFYLQFRKYLSDKDLRDTFSMQYETSLPLHKKSESQEDCHYKPAIQNEPNLSCLLVDVTAQNLAECVNNCAVKEQLSAVRCSDCYDLITSKHRINCKKDHSNGIHQCLSDEEKALTAFDANKAVKPTDFSENLVIQLKRFSSEKVVSTNGKTSVRITKITDPVTFPLDNFSPEADKLFRLDSVVLHSGNVGGGHYTALKRSDDGSWFMMDDLSSKPIDKSTMQTIASTGSLQNVKDYENFTPYVFFYSGEPCASSNASSSSSASPAPAPSSSEAAST